MTQQHYRVTLSSGGGKVSLLLSEEDAKFIQTALTKTGERFAVWYVSPSGTESLATIIDPTAIGFVNLYTGPPDGNVTDVGVVRRCPLPPPPPLELSTEDLVRQRAPVLTAPSVIAPPVPSAAPVRSPEVDPRPDLRRPAISTDPVHAGEAGVQGAGATGAGAAVPVMPEPESPALPLTAAGLTNGLAQSA